MLEGATSEARSKPSVGLKDSHCLSSAVDRVLQVFLDCWAWSQSRVVFRVDRHQMLYSLHIEEARLGAGVHIWNQECKIQQYSGVHGIWGQGHRILDSHICGIIVR